MPKETELSPENVMNMFKAQFGNAVKAYWWYDGDFCPCCLTRRIDAMIYEGKEALSINGFMYRERGVLIAYLLCGKCAEKLVAEKPTKPTSMHKAIEENLVSAYLLHLNSFT